jgi:hypothetical protein
MMTEHLESKLREALTARAGELPHSTGARLRRIDYQPRTRSLRPPVALGAVTAAGAAGAAVWLAGLGAGTTEAFAGWTPTPTPAGQGQVAGAVAACKQSLLTMPGPARVSPGASSPPKATLGARTSLRSLSSPRLPKGTPPSVAKADAALQPALTDSRGPFTFVIFAGPHSSASCITGPSFTSLAATASTGSTKIPAGRVTLSSSHMTTRDGRRFSFAEGHAASDVTGTSLVLDDGTRVEASTANGWFVAWWPGGHDVRSADVTTPTATTTQTFHPEAAPPCRRSAAAAPAGPCTSVTGVMSGPGAQSGVSSGSVSMNESTSPGP